MEIRPSVTVILSDEELGEVLRDDRVYELFQKFTARDDVGDGVFVGGDGKQLMRRIVGPPGLMRQIFSSIDQPPAP